MSGTVPPTAARALGRAAGLSRPVCPGCGRCGRGDPARAPQRAPLQAGVARCGGGGRASPRGGGAFRRCEGHLRSGAPPPPAARPRGGLVRTTTHVLRSWLCGCGGPALLPWLACPVGAACRGVVGGHSRGGVACHLCKGRLVSGAVPPPAARPLGRAVGVPRPVCPWCVGTLHRAHSVRPCGPALRAVGLAEGCPRGGAIRCREGRLRLGAPPPRLLALRAGCRGLPPTCCGCGCVGVGAQHCPLGFHALSGLRAARVVGGRARGGGGCLPPL